MKFDIFISHASEDKETVAKPLAKELQALGYSIWFDEINLKLGDSLSQSISKALTSSRFGIAIISLTFLKKRWTNYELSGLTARENFTGEKVILPIWHKVTPQDVKEYALPLLDKLAATTDNGLFNVVAKIVDVVGEPMNISEIVDDETTKRRQDISRDMAKNSYTIELYNEWHSEKLRESRIFVSAWTKEYYKKNSPLPNLTKVENEGGQVEHHIFHLIHFFEKWALLSKNDVIDKMLITKLIGSYLVWYETNLIDPLMLTDERNQDFKNLLKVIKAEVFNNDIHKHNL